MPGIAYKKRWTHWAGYPVRRALACGMWSEASAAFEIGRCASVGVADRCRQGHAQGILVAALGILAARTDSRRRRREQG